MGKEIEKIEREIDRVTGYYTNLFIGECTNNSIWILNGNAVAAMVVYSDRTFQEFSGCNPLLKIYFETLGYQNIKDTEE